MRKQITYPFSAIVGQEKMKKALLLNAINPQVGGVLIKGQKGTAKSTVVRALTAILPAQEVVEDCPFGCFPYTKNKMCFFCQERFGRGEVLATVLGEAKVVDLPLNATEDRLVGALDLEITIKEGRKKLDGGILSRANRNLLYIDEVNLLADHLVEVILDTAASGINLVEREGISFAHPAEFILVGTMNPEEGALRPQFLDRFGLVVDVEGIVEANDRVEIIERRELFDNDPLEFYKQWQVKEDELKQKIVQARAILPHVKISNYLLRLIAEIAVKANVHGHRADIIMTQTAKAIACYDIRDEVTQEDVLEAAALVLAHRQHEEMSEQPQTEHEQTEQESEEEESEEESLEEEPQDESPAETPEEELSGESSPENSQAPPPVPDELDDKSREELADDQEEPGKDQQQPDISAEEILFEIGDIFRVKQLAPPPDKLLRKGSGRRSKTKTSEKSGRYVRSTIPFTDKLDLAFDATLRAAAPFQRRREKKGRAIAIEKQDIRHKIREKRVGNTILFVVDASGSMGAQQRMVATKGAIMSLLADAYQRRDHIGMIAFRGEKAELLLSPTRSVDLAHKKLQELPTGGKTPLAKGLALAYEVMLGQLAKDVDIVPVIVLVSDGRANVPLLEEDPVQDALKVANYIKASQIKSIVIDTENDFISLGITKTICKALEGQYYKIKDLQAEQIASKVRGER